MKTVKYMFLITPLYWASLLLGGVGVALCHRAVVINTWVSSTLQSIAK